MQYTGKEHMTDLKKFFKEEIVLVVLVFLGIILTFAVPGHINEYISFVDWQTVMTLLLLIVIATGLKESGYLDLAAEKILAGIKNERMLAAFMATLSMVLSAFLTNDITLFIVVPLTLCMQKILKNDLVKVVVFEAIAVNTGSTLTPIGNPQNLFLWDMWGISFTGFIIKMAPIFGLMAAVLYFFTLFFFRNTGLQYNVNAEKIRTNRALGILSSCLMAGFLAALQFKSGLFLLPVILILYFIIDKKVLLDIDWFLIATFILMFIDFALLAKLGAVVTLLKSVDMSKSRGVFAAAALLSQAMSNVPAAIFTAKFSGNWKAIAYGVDCGGNGIIIGSLANLIALRLIRPKRAGSWWVFHKYSIPFFIITGIVVYFFL
jgi:Na+/H+ antiporter NhaD/arsenite permease-like protein